jgi:DNA-binding PadR family transcriptional regulator
MSELEGLGHKPSEHTLRNLASRLKDEGYLEIRFAGGSRFRSAAFIQLTEYGRKEAHDVDPLRTDAA